MPTSALPRPAPAVLVWTAIIILYVVWGSTYLGLRVAVGSIPPFVMGAIRFAVAGLVMLAAVALLRHGALSRPTWREWRDCFIVGALLMGGGMGAVAWSEQTVPSGIAGVLVAMVPVWIAILGRIFLAERLPGLAAVGIVTGMVGVVLLVGPGVTIDRSLDPAGIVALIISPIAWASGSLFSAHRAHLPKDPFVTTGLQMISGAVVLGVAAIASGELGGFRTAAISADSIIAVAYLTLIGSLVAYTSFVWVLRHAPLPLVATYAFVNPVIAVILGALILGETISPAQLVAGAVIVAGVALIILARSRMPATNAPATEIVASGDEPVAA